MNTPVDFEAVNTIKTNCKYISALPETVLIDYFEMIYKYKIEYDKLNERLVKGLELMESLQAEIDSPKSSYELTLDSESLESKKAKLERYSQGYELLVKNRDLCMQKLENCYNLESVLQVFKFLMKIKDFEVSKD